MKLTKRLGAVLMMAMLVLAMSMSASAAKAKISKKSQTIAVGDSFTLKLKNASGKVKWSSSNKSVATVKKGKVTGIAGGGATITAKNNKKTYKCAVTVEEVKLTGVTSPIEMAIGAKQDLKGFIKAYPNDLPLDFSSSDTSIATVDANGVITAVKTGDATITLKSKSTTAQTTIAVKVKGLAEEEAKKENANIVVINDDNFDELFDKYFGRVVVSTYYRDKAGNLLNPENYVRHSVRTQKEAAVVKDGVYQKVDADGLPDYDSAIIGHPIVEERYAYYLKDGSISDLMTYGGAMMQYHINVYEVGISGSKPVFAKLVRSIPLGADTIPTGYGTVKINESQKVSLARMFFPKAETTKIYYDVRTQHNGLIRQETGSKVVVYSVQGIDNKAMLGFDFATVETLGRVDGETPRDFKYAGSFLNFADWNSLKSKDTFDEGTDILSKVEMVRLEDDMFRFVDFHLYKKR